MTAQEDCKAYIIHNQIDLESGEPPLVLIRNIDHSYSKLGTGPFTMEARKNILRKLLFTERDLPQKYNLIRNEELIEIKKIWEDLGYLGNDVQNIYHEVYGKNFFEYTNDVELMNLEDIQILEKISNQNGVDSKLILKLLKISQNQLGILTGKML